MKKLILMIVFVGMNLISGMANAAPVQWSIGDGGNGHWYEFVGGGYTWGDADTDAKSRIYLGYSGHLASITSAAENTFVWNNFSVHMDAWLGGYQTNKDAEPDGNWAWTTGEEWNYTNWKDGQPSNIWSSAFPNLGTEDYLELYYDGTWNDVRYEGNSGYIRDFGYIVEYGTTPVPEPATMLLLGSGLIGLAGFRRRLKDCKTQS